MPETLKVLGQAAPLAATLTTLYTVPAATSATCSTLAVCNRSAVEATFRVAVSVAGAAIANSQYLYYDVALPASDTFMGTLGLTLAATDVVRVYGSTAELSFSLFGVEIS